ncbi:HEPN domain-containing protein [Candidatus Woesearchaeota archaeon]|nr:HEPN domain-containing protein [Candidatus Woesearchaeota archaeon]
MNIDDCINKNYLEKIKPDNQLSDKEMKEALYDLEKAKKAFDDEDYKWSIVKSYYAMFHAAKALLFKLGYREKRHIAVLIVLESLNKSGKLEKKYIDIFKGAMYSREGADYNYTYSKDTAEYDLEAADEFITQMKKLLEMK